MTLKMTTAQVVETSVFCVRSVACYEMVTLTSTLLKHHLQTKHQIDWDSVTCITYSTDYYHRHTLGSWFTSLDPTQQLSAPNKRLMDGVKQN